MTNTQYTPQPLHWKIPIADPKTGAPTPEFQRAWDQIRGLAATGFRTLLGDVTGLINATTVAKIQGIPVKAGTPADKAVLTYVAANKDLEYILDTEPVDVDYGSFIVVDATHYYVAMVVSLADPEYVYSGGIPVYVLNPGFTP